jgi:hypothetical protein
MNSVTVLAASCTSRGAVVRAESGVDFAAVEDSQAAMELSSAGVAEQRAY